MVATHTHAHTHTHTCLPTYLPTYLRVPEAAASGVGVGFEFEEQVEGVERAGLDGERHGRGAVGVGLLQRQPRQETGEPPRRAALPLQLQERLTKTSDNKMSNIIVEGSENDDGG